jgi:uncharacterized membrane protein
MGTRWLHREGPKWVDEGLITAQQLDALQKKYTSSISSKNILITIGFFCMGIGILSIVEAQWYLIIPIARVAILSTGVLAAFGAGIWAYRRGARALCESFIIFGVLLLGASVILISQTYDYTDYNKWAYSAWTIAALLCAALIRSTWCGIIGLVLLIVDRSVQFPFMDSGPLWLIATAVLGVICLHRSVRPQWVFAWTICMFVQFVLFIDPTDQFDFHAKTVFFYTLAVAMYVFASYTKQSNARWIQFPCFIIAYGLCVSGQFGLLLQGQQALNTGISIVALIVWAAALIHHYWRASERRIPLDLPALIVFFPIPALFSLIPAIPQQQLIILIQILHFGILLSIGLIVLIRGAAMSSRTLYQMGTALVLFALTVGFISFIFTASGFTIRSVLFLSFGALILMISLALSRKHKQLFSDRPSITSKAE